LSWLRSNAPQTQVVVVANKVQIAAQLEISRKDFEGSIERKVDFAIPFDQKLAAQAAKLGKPLAEAGKNSKTIQPMVDLAANLMAVGDSAAPIDSAGKPGKKATGAKGTSLIGKFNLKGMISQSGKKK
jgi:pilus assembly protein CpaE